MKIIKRQETPVEILQDICGEYNLKFVYDDNFDSYILDMSQHRNSGFFFTNREYLEIVRLIYKDNGDLSHWRCFNNSYKGVLEEVFTRWENSTGLEICMEMDEWVHYNSPVRESDRQESEE